MLCAIKYERCYAHVAMNSQQLLDVIAIGELAPRPSFTPVIRDAFSSSHPPFCFILVSPAHRLAVCDQ